MRVFILFIGLLMAFNLQAEPTEVIASVDKNPATADEAIVLTVTANDSVDSDAFDPSALMQDFIVGRTSVSSQTQMINFKTSKTTQWTTMLIPRKPGRFNIPAFSVAGQQTQPIDLMVVPASATRQQASDVFITAKVEAEEVYLQQQVGYTLKIHLAKQLQRGSLAEPELANADIRQLGKDKDYTELVNGKRYRVIERNFVVVPHTSGELTISGPLFEGELLNNRGQRFGFFNQTKPITKIAPSVSLTVLPVPAGIQHHWLPSEQVQLHQEWQVASSSGEYRVGEPITRIITLTALGVLEQQLPEVIGAYPDSVKIYPEQASTTTVERDNNLIAQRVETIAIIPSKSGQLNLPAVEVPWFNVITKEQEVAILPAQTLNILPALDGNTGLPAAPPLSVPAAVERAQGPVITSAPEGPQWWSISSWLLLGLWLGTLLVWAISSRKRQSTVDKPVELAQNISFKQFERQFSQQPFGQRLAILQAYLNQLCGTQGKSLAYCQQQLQSDALNREIEQMLAEQYRSGAGSQQGQGNWQCQSLLNCVKQLSIYSDKTDHLKPMYPNSA